MAKKVRAYKNNQVRAEYSYTNQLGTKKYLSQVFDTRDAADSWLNEQNEIFSDKGTLENENITFGAFAEQLKKTHLREAVLQNGKRIAGLKGWERQGKYQLQNLMKFFGKAILKNIKSNHIDEYKIERCETVNIATVNRELALLRKIFYLAIKREVIDKKPLFEVNLELENKRMRILTKVERERLMNAFEYRNKQGKQTLVHLRPLVITALDCGCRRKELLTLTWQDVDFKSGILFLHGTNTKSGKPRQVPFSSAVRAELKQLHRNRKSDKALVFGVKDFSVGWARLCEVAKIDGFWFRDSRHVAATNFVRAGMNHEIAKRILGHETDKVFQRYVNLDAEDLSRDYQKVESYLHG